MDNDLDAAVEFVVEVATPNVGVDEVGDAVQVGLEEHIDQVLMQLNASEGAEVIAEVGVNFFDGRLVRVDKQSLALVFCFAVQSGDVFLEPHHERSDEVVARDNLGHLHYSVAR